MPAPFLSYNNGIAATLFLYFGLSKNKKNEINLLFGGDGNEKVPFGSVKKRRWTVMCPCFGSQRVTDLLLCLLKKSHHLYFFSSGYFLVSKDLLCPRDGSKKGIQAALLKGCANDGTVLFGIPVLLRLLHWIWQSQISKPLLQKGPAHFFVAVGDATHTHHPAACVHPQTIPPSVVRHLVDHQNGLRFHDVNFFAIRILLEQIFRRGAVQNAHAPSVRSLQVIS
mmetsp:Transcript_39725/g.102354  ORF Transcript_39725/g.102354 Transcript_39725/m.102354 type:complete len:224 (+) Transcript_39725:776-1447(+)